MFSSSQLLELLIVFSVAEGSLYGLRKVRSTLAHAEATSGPVRPDTLPSFFGGTLSAVLQVTVCAIVPVVYTFSLVGSGFQRPAWMGVLALPEEALGIKLGEAWKTALRVFACIACASLKSVTDSVFDHLSDQYHPIGRREKPRVVQTGPYAWVRHPLYSIALLQSILQSLAFWSYAPLLALVAIAIMFAVKIQVEEATIQRDDAIKEEYRAYMRKVPARLVPYVW